jgi:hypothetical protein
MAQQIVAVNDVLDGHVALEVGGQRLAAAHHDDGVAGQVHVAVADAEGHDEFRPPNIAQSQAQVFVSTNAPTTVEAAGGPFGLRHLRGLACAEPDAVGNQAQVLVGETVAMTA